MSNTEEENPLIAPAKKLAREVSVFTLPKSLANGITSMGLVCLTPEEEIMAYNRAGGDAAKGVAELLKASLAQINGKPVSLADGSSDIAWRDMEPKVRALLQKAWKDMHHPSEQEESDFLASRKTVVG